MEEKEKTAVPNKLTYEQLEQLAMQLQAQFRNIDFASIRLDWLFRVLEHRESLSESFVMKCAMEIEKLLTIDNKKDTTED